jgi:hypothetical protein
VVIFALSPHSTNGRVVAELAELGFLPEPVLDPTYGEEGGMWTSYRPRDLTVVHNDHDFRQLPAEWADRFGSSLFDPPYRLSGTATNVEGFDERYGTNRPYRPLAEVRHDMLTGLSECARVTRPRGYVIVKCQDQISSGKYQWQVGWVINHALSEGMELVDQVHIKSYRSQPVGRTQKHTRRNYSTFVVLQVKE